MMESQLEVVKGSEWDEILRQGDTSSYEEIQEAIRRDSELDKAAAKEVQSFSNIEVEDEQADDVTSEKKAVVIFPEDDEGQHFNEESSSEKS